MMAESSSIEWTDATWNPVTGCSVVSPGCTNCYAMKLAGTRLQHHPSRAGLTRDTKAGPVWTGEVRLNEQWLDQPQRWRRPRRIFVCAHGDLFHENVPDEWIDRIFAVMALAPQHTFQVLTKRAQRMRRYVSEPTVARRVWDAACEVQDTIYALAQHGALWGGEAPWPLRNVWLGVSAETQHWADHRIPHLLETPAAIRFISAEPLLGPLDLEPYLKPVREWSNVWLNVYPFQYPKHRLDWAIVGGESGRRPRDNDFEENARAILAQCEAAGAAFFGKQNVGKKPLPADLLERRFPAPSPMERKP